MAKKAQKKDEKFDKNRASRANHQGNVFLLASTKTEQTQSPRDTDLPDIHKIARIPQNTGTLKNIGKFPSLKNKKTVWFESHLERDFIYLIEFDRDVIQYQEQPFKIRYLLNNKQHYYTPDFLIKRKNKKQIIEIKPQSKIEKEEFIHFSNHMRNLLIGEGYEYIVVTDSTIRIQPKLSNIKLFWRYSRLLIGTEHQILIYKIFDKLSSISFAQLSSILTQSTYPKEIIFTLIFHGYLLIDIEKSINEESIISIGVFN